LSTTETKHRRGTESQCDAMTPAEGEIIVDMTNDRLRLGDGSRTGGFQIPNSEDVQGNKMAYAAATGTNDIAATYAPAPTTPFADGAQFTFKAAATNTGSVTFNPNAAGADQVVKNGTGGLADLVAGDIISGGVYTVRRTGSQWHLISSSSQQEAFIGFRASLTFTINDGTLPTKMTFNSETFDQGGYYDNSSSRFQPPAGYYLIGSTINRNRIGASNFRSYSIYVNGSPYASAVYTTSTGTSTDEGEVSFSVNSLVYLDGGSYAEIYWDATGSQVVAGSYFYGYKVG